MVRQVRYLTIATWMVLGVGVVAAILFHVASGAPLAVPLAFEWIAAIAQVGAFLIVAVNWHEQLAMIETLSRRLDLAERNNDQLARVLAAWLGPGQTLDDGPATR